MSTFTDSRVQRLWQPLDPAWIVLLALMGLTSVHLLNERLVSIVQEMQAQRASLDSVLDMSRQARDRAVMLNALKRSDVAHFKSGFTATALSQKSLYENGLSLQEERRLLDKQLEIMTTHLQISPALQRIFLLRGDEPLQSMLISYFPLKAFGGASDHLPPVIRIVSKERFANPERGESQLVNGQLVWMPPQIGTSIRSNALGEYVMFTNSKLILHGPPLNEEDHARFPHVCLGLTLDAARKLYRGSFIGTRITVAATGDDSQ